MEYDEGMVMLNNRPVKFNKKDNRNNHRKRIHTEKNERSPRVKSISRINLDEITFIPFEQTNKNDKKFEDFLYLEVKMKRRDTMKNKV